MITRAVSPAAALPNRTRKSSAEQDALGVASASLSAAVQAGCARPTNDDGMDGDAG